MDIKQIRIIHEQMKKKCHADEANLELLEKQKFQKEKELFDIQKESHDKKLMKELLEKASDEARKNGKEILSQTASSALQMVLGENHAVSIELGNLRGVPSAELLISKEYSQGILNIDPMEDGGGIRDLVSLSTFMATGMLVGEENQSPYFLDEPTKFVSKDRAEEVAGFMKELVAYTGKQTFLVTHDQEHLPAVGDTTYRIENIDGVSVAIKQ
jgi:predicted ABC-type transport system involved in lysophospholipase L1 biosynthesis ATPase subunit